MASESLYKVVFMNQGKIYEAPAPAQEPAAEATPEALEDKAKQALEGILQPPAEGAEGAEGVVPEQAVPPAVDDAVEGAKDAIKSLFD